MNFADVNSYYTSTLKGLLDLGLTVNCGTQDGSQDEICKVDLTDGDRVFRLLLAPFTESDADGFYTGVAVRLGKVWNRVKPNEGKHMGNYVWNNDLDVISEKKYYVVDGEHTPNPVYTCDKADALNQRRGMVRD